MANQMMMTDMRAIPILHWWNKKFRQSGNWFKTEIKNQKQRTLKQKNHKARAHNSMKEEWKEKNRK